MSRNSDDVRCDIRLTISSQTLETIDRIAGERNVQRTGLVLQALGLLHVAHDASKKGYHLGLTKDREKLDTELIAPL